MASMTSPEQGAQQECNSTFLWPPGGIRFGRVVSFMELDYQTRGQFSTADKLGNDSHKNEASRAS